MANNRLVEMINKWKEVNVPPTSLMAYSTNRNVLCFSSGSNFFVLNPDFSVQKIAEREGKILVICNHEGGIYDAGDYGIFNTLTNKAVSKRKGRVLTLCSNKSKLYDAGDYKQIFETFRNKKVATRSGAVSKLFSYQGNLYDYGNYWNGELFKTLENKVVAQRLGNIEKVVCYNDTLYDVNKEGKMHETFSNKLIADTKRKVDFFISYTQLYNSLSNNPELQISEDFLSNLNVCIHERALYGYTENTIFEGMQNRKFFFDSEINLLKSYPRRLFIKQGIKLNGKQ